MSRKAAAKFVAQRPDLYARLSKRERGEKVAELANRAFSQSAPEDFEKHVIERPRIIRPEFTTEAEGVPVLENERMTKGGIIISG